MAGAASGPGSGKVVNLRAARKSAARDTARRQGDANAAKFGRSRAQKLSEEDARQRARQHLDAHRRDGAMAPPVDPAYLRASDAEIDADRKAAAESGPESESGSEGANHGE